MSKNKQAVPSIDLNGLLTSQEVAKILGIAPHTLAKWRMEGKGPRYFRVGRLKSNCLYERVAVEAYLLSRTVYPVGEAA